MVTGSAVLSLTVCEREAWLIAHQIEPDQSNPYLEVGRFIHQESYPKRGIREVSLPGMKIDMIFQQGKVTIVGEIKKSSKFLEGARMQLLYYLYELEKRGVKASGKIMIPRERKQVEVRLGETEKEELERFLEKAERILSLPKVPERKKTGFCRKCGYELFCWS